jgi:hypothetical protein
MLWTRVAVEHHVVDVLATDSQVARKPRTGKSNAAPRRTPGQMPILAGSSLRLSDAQHLPHQSKQLPRSQPRVGAVGAVGWSRRT